MPNGYIYDQAAMSRSETILGAEINTDDPVYDQPPLSRIEYLLKQLEEQTSHILRIKDVVPSVEDLPATGNEDGDLYFVGPNEDETYDEYVYVEDKGEFEKLGSTDIDISQFVLKAGDTMTGTLNAPRVCGTGGTSYTRFQYTQAREIQFGGVGPNGGYNRNGFKTVAWVGPSFETIHSGGDDWDEGIQINVQLSSDGRSASGIGNQWPFVLKFYSTETGSLVSYSGLYATVSGYTDPTTGEKTYYCDVKTPIPESRASSGTGFTYNSFVPKAYVDAKAAAAVSENFETALLSYIDNHIKTQAEYDQLQDKTGFWFIKDSVT